MKRVLLVEDNEIILAGLLTMLRFHMRDHIFLSAENGLDGLDVLGKEEVDLIVTDLNMPVMDGYEFMSHARKAFPKTPIFVMTAEAEHDLVEQRTSIFGVSGVFYKPFDIVEMSKAISEELATTKPAPDVALTLS